MLSITNIKNYFTEILIVILLTILYLNYIPGWLSEWSDPDGVYAFGFFVLGFIAYLAWFNYKKLLEIDVCPNKYGVILLLLALAAYVIGKRADIDQGVNLSLPLFISGIVLCLRGIETFKLILLPLILLVFALPILPIYRITLPLQLISTELSSFLISSLGVNTLTEGTTLYIEKYRISVVAACSGLRSSSTLFFMSIIFCYFINSRFIVKMLFVAFSIPMALAANAIRISIVGFYVLYNGYDGMQEFHDSLGIFTFIVSVAIMIMVARFIDKKKDSEKTDEN